LARTLEVARRNVGGGGKRRRGTGWNLDEIVTRKNIALS